MYAVILADGFFGDTTTVHEVYADSAKAIKSVQHDRRWQVIGSPTDHFTVGQTIYGNTIGQIYPRVEKR